VIEIRGLSFSYRTGEADAVEALRGLDLRVEPGQFVAIIGHNGSGKSTLVKLLTAVLYPTDGEIRIEGIPVREENQWEIRERVAIAGSLAMRPRFLILDEPTSLLPAPTANRLISTVKELNRREEMGVLHVTHSMSEAALFDRVVVMDEGRKVMDGTPAEVFRRVDELREIGLDVPLAASLAHRLRSRGVPLAGDILSDADLREAISALRSSRAESTGP
jgi:energy-coupling factor transporter ATP-binding protein EcfA2